MTLGLYGAVISLSLFVNDLGVIFEIVGAFGFGFICFGFPALIYLILMSKDERRGERRRKEKTVLITRIGSCLMIFFCLADIVLVLIKMFTKPSSE